LGLGILGVVTLFFYTAPPLKLGYRGLGELMIGLDFGVLPMLGTEYVLTRQMSVEMLWVSVPVALLIVGVLWVNEFPDADADALVGKRHLVVILGRSVAAKVLTAMYILTLLLTAGAVMLGWLPPAALIAMAAGLPAAQAAQALVERPDDPQAWRVACPRGVAAHALYGVLLFLAVLFSGAPTLK
ncbi:MAG: prenyltransferase, partial [Armatimonadetes bacterium]|nr:prenyltransferase [Armatimonadota bacterium]